MPSGSRPLDGCVPVSRVSVCVHVCNLVKMRETEGLTGRNHILKSDNTVFPRLCRFPRKVHVCIVMRVCRLRVCEQPGDGLKTAALSRVENKFGLDTNTALHLKEKKDVFMLLWCLAPCLLDSYLLQDPIQDFRTSLNGMELHPIFQNKYRFKTHRSASQVLTVVHQAKVKEGETEPPWL